MKYILGIDVGGTKIAAGLVNKSFAVSHVAVLPTSHSDLLNQLKKLIKSYQGYASIGLALPGQVLSSGQVIRLPNIPGFKSQNLKKTLEATFKVRVNVLNDAKAFALAEASIGAGKKHKVVAGVILGTGIGVGIVMNKQIYYGANSLAGEMGHFITHNGQYFEQYVKKQGRFKTALQAKPYINLLEYFIVRSFDPEIIVIGGGWSRLPGMAKMIKTRSKDIHKFRVKTKVRISKLKNAGIIGAAMSVLKK